MDVMESGQLGKYRLRGRIDRGAGGTVYESWDPDLARRVIIKVMPIGDLGPDREEKYIQFLGEAQAAERLHHPNIVSVFGSGRSRNSAYLVQDYVEGSPLSASLAQGEPLHLVEIARIMESVLNGLHYSHGRGVFHGDLRPTRIMSTKNGQIKITGFGLTHLDPDVRTRGQESLKNVCY